MKKLVQLEEIALFATTLYAFSLLNLSWWWFIGCILLPDVSMIGYLHHAKTGAWFYNIFHHRALALIVLALGFFLNLPWVLFTGLILFSHATMDRMFGYGLKYESGFKKTHLGEIGKQIKIYELLFIINRNS